MRSSSSGYGRQPSKPPSQVVHPFAPHVPKPPSSSGKRQTAHGLKENITSNVRSTAVTRNASSGLRKQTQEKIPVRKQLPPRQQYFAQQPRQNKQSVRPPSGKGAFQNGGGSFRAPMVVNQQLEQCRECGRKFNEKALAKYQKVCKKVFSQKRKVFNSAKQRIVSKQQVQILKRNQNSHKYEQKNAHRIPKWKQQSLEFRVAMKQAKGIAPTFQQLKIAQQVRNEGSGLKLCKFCNRRFNEVAAQRHIPFCQRKTKEMNLRKPMRR